MGEHLVKADKLMVPRKMRFTKQFMDDLTSLVSVLTRDIIDRCVEVCVMTYSSSIRTMLSI